MFGPKFASCELSYGSCGGGVVSGCGTTLGAPLVINQTMSVIDSAPTCIQLAGTCGWVCRIFMSMPVEKCASRRYFSLY
jgi:hypothetical protein